MQQRGRLLQNVLHPEIKAQLRFCKVSGTISLSVATTYWTQKVYHVKFE